MTWGEIVDTAVDRSVVLGFSRIGYALRQRLPSWPEDLPAHALSGKRIGVTGATSGIGERTARDLAALGADVQLVVRNPDKGERVAEQIRSDGGSAQVWRCDVGDLDSVRSFTSDYLRSSMPLDGLVHNAGALPPQRERSEQGHELTMAIHVLGPVLMTERLRPAWRDRGARIVLVTSGGMYAQRLRPDDPDYRDGEYSGTTAYARSKRAQVELLPILQRRWSRADAAAYATHPGWVATPGVSSSIPGFERVTRPILRGEEGGSDTTVWLLGVQPRRPGGGLWHDRRERPTHLLPRTRTDEADRQQMWDWVCRQIDLDAWDR